MVSEEYKEHISPILVREWVLIIKCVLMAKAFCSLETCKGQLVNIYWALLDFSL